MEHFDFQEKAIIISGLPAGLVGSGVTVTMIHPGFVASEVRQRTLGADGKPPGLVDRIALQAIQSGR
jgi:NAD(P)-dependent dehydrogenase (short-subunit alcohol dehydrogenase family)